MALAILLVDDEPVFRAYIRQMDFWKNGEFILAGEAGNGDEALAFMKKNEVDVVIMDVSMPGKNGVVLSEIIGRQYPGVVIVAVSSYDDYDYVREILKNGADDYILKGRLSEEFLLLTLRNAATRLNGRTPWETKMELRRQTKEWLVGEGINPFTSDNCRKVASLLKVRTMDRTSIVHEREVLDGIGKTAESFSTEDMDILACTREPDTAVLLTRFYGTVSEAEIKRQLECNRVMIQDAVWSIYHLRLECFHCPFFFNDNSLKSFLRHKLEEVKEETPEKTALSLSIRQHKRLLAVVEDHDSARAEVLIKEIYEEIPLENTGLCILVTKELLELIERISVEWRIELDFLPREFMLFQYARVKSREALVSSISGLYKNVLREIAEREEKEKKYSDVVKHAILFQKEHYKTPISLRMIAEGIGVNSSYLSRIFHDETGMTITDYLNTIRMEEARRLVEEGTPLKEVVSLCGFRNYGYFLRIFKEYTGKTPKEYLAGR